MCYNDHTLFLCFVVIMLRISALFDVQYVLFACIVFPTFQGLHQLLYDSNLDPKEIDKAKAGQVNILLL